MVARRQRIASLIKNEAAPGEMRTASGLGLILIKLTREGSVGRPRIVQKNPGRDFGSLECQYDAYSRKGPLVFWRDTGL